LLQKTAFFFLKIVYAARLMTLCGIALILPKDALDVQP
jgi:hypothetical protein